MPDYRIVNAALENMKKRRKPILVGVGALVALIGVFLLGRWLSAPLLVANGSAPGEIVARGRIEPVNRVIAVSGPVDSPLIQQLLVAQGDKVGSGQVLAVLEGFELRRADFEAAKANLRLAELQRVQVQAGAKQADIAAQQNIIVAKQAQLLRVQNEWRRRDSLYRASAISTQSFEEIQDELDEAKSEEQQAQNTLKSLTEVRSVDDAVAGAQIDVAKANVARAKASMERLQIRAPSAGDVLSIEARAGEAIPPDGILRMGDLSNLIAVAEVDQSDAARVTVGMSAEITGDMLPQTFKAKVTRIAYEVFRQKRPSSDILVGRDARIVEVEVTPATPLPPIVGGELVIRLIPGQEEKN
jgi:HlyD family secretion protein